MTPRWRALVGVTASGLLLASGAVVAGALQDAPQDAQPAADPIADALRQQEAPAQPIVLPQTPAPSPAPVAPILVAEAPAQEEVEEADVEEAEVEPTEVQPEEEAEPQPRQRRPIAIVQAVDKATAETMRFEVEVGGRPVRFNSALIFTARACEVNAPDERDEEAAAYLEVTLQPRGAIQPQARQIFRGWMFASSPALTTLQHPVYDAWVVGCKA